VDEWVEEIAVLWATYSSHKMSFVKYFSSLKRVVRYLSDPKALSKYLRRVAKKHSPCSVDFNRINPAEIGSVFCIAIRGILPKHGANGNERMTIEAIWSAEVEASW
jgi:hypothetical protein